MLGWLHATPDGDKQPRIKSEDWPLPDCGAFSYLVEWFIELRYNFGYVDVKAWADLVGVNPEPWEVNLLMGMSSTYNNGVIEYRKKGYDVKPPYKPDNISHIINKRLSKLFGD